METDIRDQVLDALGKVSGTTVTDNRATIRPRAADHTPRLRANRNGKGYVTSYTLSIGCAEAAAAGFLGEDKMPLPLMKIVDPENHTITFTLKS